MRTERVMRSMKTLWAVTCVLCFKCIPGRTGMSFSCTNLSAYPPTNDPSGQNVLGDDERLSG